MNWSTMMDGKMRTPAWDDNNVPQNYFIVYKNGLVCAHIWAHDPSTIIWSMPSQKEAVADIERAFS